MFAYFLLGTLLLLAVLLVGRWFVRAEPRQLMAVGRWFLIALVALVAIFLLITGRLWLAAAAVSTVLPVVIRLIQAARMARNYARMAGLGGGRTSSIRTRFLAMTLDHDSGRLEGEVIAGPLAGRRLADLSREDRLALLQLCQAEDPPSAQVLEAYLDRMDPAWRQAHPGAGDTGTGQTAPPSGGSIMTREDAFRVLGLAPGASEAEIRAAHHRLIALVHPDRGGSAFLAAQINQARDLLLGR